MIHPDWSGLWAAIRREAQDGDRVALLLGHRIEFFTTPFAMALPATIGRS